jgi:hypothetical protein
MITVGVFRTCAPPSPVRTPYACVLARTLDPAIDSSVSGRIRQTTVTPSAENEGVAGGGKKPTPVGLGVAEGVDCDRDSCGLSAGVKSDVFIGLTGRATVGDWGVERPDTRSLGGPLDV